MEQLDSKLVGWKAKLLFKASHLVLIKVLGMAASSYTMQSTFLPKIVCAKLHLTLRRFW